MRPVVWVILAILVVAAIIFVVVARRGATPEVIKREWNAEEYAKYADKMDKYVTHYEERLAKLTEKGIAPQAQPMVDQFKTKVEEVKNAVANLRDNNSQENVEKIRTLYKELKKIFRDMGGAAEAGDTEE